MNPIEKALDNADKVIAANAELERISALASHGVTLTEVDGKRAITLAQSVEQVKKEVLEILRDGVQTSRGFERPSADDIKNFGALHDLCDANCLGWLCDEDVVFVDEQGPILDHEYGDRWLEFGNKVQNEVHAWIEAKGHHPVHVRTEGCNPATCNIDHALAFDASLEDKHLPFKIVAEVPGLQEFVQSVIDTNEVIKQSLVVAFDVTGWTRAQIDDLLAAASAQGEESSADDIPGFISRPDVESVESEIIEHDGDLDLTGVLHVGLG